MRITEKDVLYVADLANLELTPQERERMAKNLDSILGYIDRLNELDTTNVSPMAQINSADKTPWRDDVLRPSLSHQDAMANAPSTDGEFFKVPKVIDK